MPHTDQIRHPCVLSVHAQEPSQEQAAQTIARGVLRTVPGGQEQALRDSATFFESDLPELGQHTFPDAIGGLSQPVLHISAGDSPFESSHAVGRLAPSFADVEIADVGHGLQMVRPVEVAAVIADFLNRHPMT